eukprot:CAMPEP_0174250292 /NCGR_PEP_ID=MMETSP0439-20130205/511_1 /TAXON_ID=0 /ORGANISM="Stereomyxa ramosa, Strain Chinc5" /LENGTH=100 /DNA_ID=CAMNT_0015330319 /DNA_START=85 /DNA_END=384 /DNA_ORIENTATION=+
MPGEWSANFTSYFYEMEDSEDIGCEREFEGNMDSQGSIFQVNSPDMPPTNLTKLEIHKHNAKAEVLYNGFQGMSYHWGIDSSCLEQQILGFYFPLLNWNW